MTAPEVNAAPRPSPFTKAQVAERFAECFASGVADLGTEEEALRPGNYCAAAKFVEKHKLDVPAAVKELDAAHGGGAPPSAVAAVAAAARATATAMLEEMEGDVARGVHAEAAVELARARRTTARSLRLCHNGRHLGSFMEATSYEPAAVADVLQGAQPGDFIWSHDFTAFFWVVRIDERWRHLYWQQYTAPDGTRVYLRGNTMTMGMKDSSSLAQAISALTCEIAMHFGAPWVRSYTDDLMARARPDQVARAVEAIAAAMQLVVPGGENVLLVRSGQSAPRRRAAARGEPRPRHRSGRSRARRPRGRSARPLTRSSWAPPLSPARATRRTRLHRPTCPGSGAPSRAPRARWC
jgi:hypothetical protein